MARAEKSNEPSMEEILASIRQIIAEEPQGRPAAVPPPPGPANRVVTPPPAEAAQPESRAAPAPVAPKPLMDVPAPPQAFIQPPVKPAVPTQPPSPAQKQAPVEPQAAKPAAAVDGGLSEAIARSFAAPRVADPAPPPPPAPTPAPEPARAAAAPLSPAPVPQADAMTRPVWRFTRPSADALAPPPPPPARVAEIREDKPLPAPTPHEPRSAQPRDLGAFVPMRSEDMRLAPIAAREPTPAPSAPQLAAPLATQVARSLEAPPVPPMSISALLPPMADEPRPAPMPAPLPPVAPAAASRFAAPVAPAAPAPAVVAAPVAATALAVAEPAVAPTKVAMPGAPIGLAPVRSIEDAVVDLLRPMLRQWLDDNMPRIIEKTLKVELAESLKRSVTGAQKSE